MAGVPQLRVTTGLPDLRSGQGRSRVVLSVAGYLSESLAGCGFSVEEGIQERGFCGGGGAFESWSSLRLGLWVSNRSGKLTSRLLQLRLILNKIIHQSGVISRCAVLEFSFFTLILRGLSSVGEQGN